jgi:hypothetical protein
VSDFRLYPPTRFPCNWWSASDYAAVLETMSERRPARVLEFGPGSSTLALIEGGAAHVDTCEDNPEWAEVYEERLARQFPTADDPTTVTVHRYAYNLPIAIPAIDGRTYDLALIDGPHGTDSRPPVVDYCMDRCAAVLSPTEDGNPAFRQALIAIAALRGWDITIRETGPLSGGFALLTPRRRVVILDETSDALANTAVPPPALTTRRRRSRKARP